MERAARALASTRRAGRRSRPSTQPAVARSAGIGHHAGEVRHQLHHRASSTRRARYVVLYADGTVQLNHGGTEMGQGLHTKMLAICAHELGVGAGARAGDDHRHRQGAQHLGHRGVERLGPQRPGGEGRRATRCASGCGPSRRGCSACRRRARRTFSSRAGKVFLTSRPELALGFEKVTQEAYLAQVSLSATGFYRTPDIHYDQAAGRGKPFHYFAYGAAVSEVEVSGLTGEHRLRRVDILHDVGASLVPTIDRGPGRGRLHPGLGLAHLRGGALRREGLPARRTRPTPTRSPPSATRRGTSA